MRSILLLISLLCVAGMSAQSRLYGNEFDLADVRLLDSPFRHAMELNTEVLLRYDTDRLLAPYLKAAGLPPKGESFSCWDGLDGHIGGHYLSALAIHSAATGNPELRARLDYMVGELTRCAEARGDGYVGGVPGGDELWAAIKAGNVGMIWKYWVPWYNVHKIYAGLRDAWVYTGSTQARKLFLGMCDWGLDVITPLSDGQMEAMLGNEFGGMDEVYADAYAMTGEKKYLDAARRFTHHELFDSMRDGRDNLDNKHANTQVPKVVGYQRIAELSGDADYDRAARFFWETVVGNRSLAIGGNSRREHFASQADAKSYVDEREGPETCNTNNMLKLTEGLFRMSRDARYADFYERALYNHILSSQHPGHGGYVYFTSARPGHYRVYSQPNAAMWCCVGTGMENHGKYGQFIYTHDADSLWINLFIPSSLDWKEKGMVVTQTTDFPDTGKTTLTVSTKGKKRVALKLRHPGWCDSVEVRVNGKRIAAASSPASYMTIDRTWKNGDVVELAMNMPVTIEELNYLPDYVAILRGPIVLGARYGKCDELPGLVADDSRWAHIAGGRLVSVFDTPLLVGERDDLLGKLNCMRPVEVEGHRAYKVDGLFDGEYADLLLEPFSDIHDSRYMMYWLAMTPGRYAEYKEEAQREEQQRLQLDSRTVDAVNTGEQQPEADHFMSAEGSRTGNFNGEPWRDASNGGYFSYRMRTGGQAALQLRLRYWGNESGAREFDIYVDDALLASENISDRWKADRFVEEEYKIPASMLEDKETVTVSFRSREATTAGGIFHVRLLRP
ncbi:MAG: glycoside hydrolase family 127 protein [Staphylococcus sp.]|nr:glycoside hydrolase family 127 protein [Staphylococcus sp.]